MRHPGIQHKDRMRELADKIAAANLEAMADRGDVARLKEQLSAAQEKAENSELLAESLLAFQRRLIAGIRYYGVNSWGLPGAISLAEWEQIVGKPSDSFYWDKDREAALAANGVLPENDKLTANEPTPEAK